MPGITHRSFCRRRRGRAQRCGELSPTGPAIGLLANATYQLGETTLLPGDLLFAFTDGVIGIAPPVRREFSQERLEAAGGDKRPGLAALAAVEAAVHAHMAGPRPSTT